MLVKEIIKKVVNYTNNYELYEAINEDTLTDKQQKEINLLVDCVNLTNVNIATNYVRLVASKEVSNLTGTLNYSKITSSTIYEVLSVKDLRDNHLSYTLTNSGILTNKGMIVVTYSYFPDNLSFDDKILNYPTKINERSFVYGVIAEYLYVKGVFDEAQIWEQKFKQEMKSLIRTQKNVKLKKRGWY